MPLDKEESEEVTEAMKHWAQGMCSFLDIKTKYCMDEAREWIKELREGIKER